jgi:hypothetical protein
MLFELPKNKKERALESIKVSSLADAGWNEKNLENLLSDNITSLIREEYLMVISQERPMQEEPDILALDKEGVLHIFELKRTQSEPEHLLQVMRYGQRFGVYDYDKLNYKFTSYEKSKGKNLQEFHKEYFNLEEKLPKDEFNKKQKFVVVTNGIDVETLRSILYWKEKGLPIEPLIYRIYKVDNKFVMDFNPYSGKREEFEITETKNHIVNTNFSYRRNAYKDMLRKNKASAYGSRKHAVDSIQKNDRVFLYHTGEGICSVGRVTSDEVEATKDGDERYVNCSFKGKVDPVKYPDKTLRPWEINDTLGTNWAFRQTRFSISDDEADKIEKMFLAKIKQ